MRNLKAFLAFTADFIVILLLVSHKFVSVNADGNNTDQLALLAFKSLIKSDPQNALISWNQSVHFCDWGGVICEHKNRRVAILDLHSKGLVGSLSPYIGNMSFLRVIRLHNNTFQSEIPNEIGRLFRLETFVLLKNSFGGEIPPNLSNCSNLKFINIGFNELVGMIPSNLESLSMLNVLSFDHNNLTGGIPPSLGNLSLLQNLSASHNFFNGRIPDALGRLKYMQVIGLGDNYLSGTIPPSLYNISSVKVFSVAINELDGTLPSNMGLLLPHLENLQMWGNHFTGSIPVSLSNATNLIYIEFEFNNFTGKIDVHYGNLWQLRFLSFAGNNLGSKGGDDFSFIFTLTNCSKLENIEVAENLLHGKLPNYLVNLSSTVTRLIFSENQIYGSLPLGLTNLANLTWLNIDNNQITGIIPNEISNMQNLYSLRLEHNRLSGKIPSSIGNLSSLNKLLLQGNILQGMIPSSLGNCHNLRVLNLSQNNLTSIPSQLFSTHSELVSMDLSQNQLVGEIPINIGNLVNLNELIVSRNQLSGEIPNSLSRCDSLVKLYMDNNRFQGSIQTALENLKGLSQLDLSNNNLSGEIPKYLEKLSLEYLNLSLNQFEGGVPTGGIFANASAISLKGNSKLCGGIQELQLPKCIDQSSKRSKRNFTKIIVIVISCTFIVILLSAFLYCWSRRKKTKQVVDSLKIKSIQKVSYHQILSATNGFSTANLVGVGSFGSVYKGRLDQDGPIVAFKVLNLQQPGASKSFMKECEKLGRIRHRNLVRIISSCSSIDSQRNDFKALVYEYMPNGNLENWLHTDSEENAKFLNFLQRISVAIDVGNALDYLHNNCENAIVHCDLKPTNILLDADMIAHVGDFGIANFLHQNTNQMQSSSIGVRGTIGFTAPEYGLGSAWSKEGDVYSYGILLLEMMTGKKPTDDIFAEGHNIHKFASISLPGRVLEIIDPILSRDDECTVDWLISMLKVGVECSMEAPHERINISDAVNSLTAIKKSFMKARRRSSAPNRPR